MVGDEDQSIYSWRGADIRNILDFEHDYPNAKTIRLEQNYRSTKNILAAAGAVVENNKERKGKKLWTEADAGELIGLYAGFDAENEALFIADTIEKLLSAQSRRPRGGALPHELPVAPDRRSAAALRAEVHRRRRLQLLPARRDQGHAGVPEAGGVAARIPSACCASSTRRRAASGGPRSSRSSSTRTSNGMSLWEAIGRMIDEQQFPTRAQSALRPSAT